MRFPKQTQILSANGFKNVLWSTCKHLADVGSKIPLVLLIVLIKIFIFLLGDLFWVFCRVYCSL